MGIEEKITPEVLTRLQDFSATPLVGDDRPNTGQREVMRYARRGGGVKASSAVRALGVRTKNITVRVMEREHIGRPVIGDRKILGQHQYGVAEYHGTRCYRVIAGMDDPLAATAIAEKAAALIGRDAQLVILDRKRKPAKKAASKSKPKKPVRTAQAIDPQRLHQRDIDQSGECQACGARSDKRSIRCGTQATETAHLRGE